MDQNEKDEELKDIDQSLRRWTYTVVDFDELDSDNEPKIIRVLNEYDNVYIEMCLREM